MYGYIWIVIALCESCRMRIANTFTVFSSSWNNKCYLCAALCVCNKNTKNRIWQSTVGCLFYFNWMKNHFILCCLQIFWHSLISWRRVKQRQVMLACKAFGFNLNNEKRCDIRTKIPKIHFAQQYIFANDFDVVRLSRFTIFHFISIFSLVQSFQRNQPSDICFWFSKFQQNDLLFFVSYLFIQKYHWTVNIIRLFFFCSRTHTQRELNKNKCRHSTHPTYIVRLFVHFYWAVRPKQLNLNVVILVFLLEILFSSKFEQKIGEKMKKAK